MKPAEAVQAAFAALLNRGAILTADGHGLEALRFEAERRLGRPVVIRRAWALQRDEPLPAHFEPPGHPIRAWAILAAGRTQIPVFA